MALQPKPLEPTVHTSGEDQWIYPVMNIIIQLAKEGDPAALELCLQLTESDTGMPFGMTLKSQAARALKKHAAQLTSDHQNRINARIQDMHDRNYRPREYLEYLAIQRRFNGPPSDK